VPPIFVSSMQSARTRIDSRALQALPQMKVRVFFILPTALERPHSCVPFVVATQAEARARHAEGRVSSWKIALRIDHPHDALGLTSLDVADEWPKEVQRSLNVT